MRLGREREDIKHEEDSSDQDTETKHILDANGQSKNKSNTQDNVGNKPDSFREEGKKELLADSREDSYDKGQQADTKEHLRTNEVGDSGNPAALATGVEAPWQ